MTNQSPPLSLFFQLVAELEQTSKTRAKQEALVAYFQQAPDSDILHTITLFTGRRPKRPMTTTQLRAWAAEWAEIPLWLFEETYHIVGDLAETIAKVIPHAPTSQRIAVSTLGELVATINSWRGLPEDEMKEGVLAIWRDCTPHERFVFNKILTGGMRIGVSAKSIVNALATYLSEDPAHIAHRLMGQWTADTTTFHDLLRAPSALDDRSKPYPFCLANPLDASNLDAWGEAEIAQYQIEYKWDGIRGQAIVREGSVFIWSRGEELITSSFPEIEDCLVTLPYSGVFDGEILAYRDGAPLSFQILQTRIGRKRPSKALQQKAPIRFLIYDLLEWEGEDLRKRPLFERREILDRHRDELEQAGLLLSESLHPPSIDQLRQLRDQSQTLGSEGLMLKRRDSHYAAGRKVGHWYKWKVAPLAIDAVLIYAMRGHGRRSNRYTDYTFAVWDGDALVPFAKAYSGLTDEEINRVDAFVKKNTTDRFGPVRSVVPELVFEIGFEGITASTRHKSGVAVRFPRILRWRTDKPVAEANTLQDLYQLLKHYESR